jgi:hypothetical protein
MADDTESVSSKRKISPTPLDSPMLESRRKVARKTVYKDFNFRLNITNGDFLRKFLTIYNKCVDKLHFRLTYSDDFQGFRIDAHNTSWTLANKSRFECRLETGNGRSLDLLNGMSFTVNAVNFMNKLSCAVIPDTVLTLTNYTNSESIVISSTSNEDDVISNYSCPLIDSSPEDGLDGLRLNAGFHVNVLTRTLRKMSNNADVCGADLLRFTLKQAVDAKDSNTIHSEIFIGFKDPKASSDDYDGTVFCVSAIKKESGDTVTWEVCDGPENREALDFVVKSSNEYDNTNLKLLLSHVACEWCMVHLDNTNQTDPRAPLVIVCELSGKNTKHTLILSARDD